MQDPDPKCRDFGFLWYFMAFYGSFAKKSNKTSNPIFRHSQNQPCCPKIESQVRFQRMSKSESDIFIHCKDLKSYNKNATQTFMPSCLDSHWLLGHFKCEHIQTYGGTS